MCILFGWTVTAILRQEGEHWRYIGDAYVHGIMEVSAQKFGFDHPYQHNIADMTSGGIRPKTHRPRSSARKDAMVRYSLIFNQP